MLDVMMFSSYRILVKHHATLLEDDGLHVGFVTTLRVRRKTRNTKLSVCHFRCTISVKKRTNSSS